MSKEKRSIKSDIVLPSWLQTQKSAIRLEQHPDQIGVNLPQKQIFSQELINRLTDRIKKI